MYFQWQPGRPAVPRVPLVLLGPPGFNPATNLCPLLFHSSAPTERVCKLCPPLFRPSLWLRSARAHAASVSCSQAASNHSSLRSVIQPSPSPSIPPSVIYSVKRTPLAQTISICSAVPLSFAAPSFHVLFSFSAVLIIPVFPSSVSALWRLRSADLTLLSSLISSLYLALAKPPATQGAVMCFGANNGSRAVSWLLL